ncbi:MAG: GtrA family protein [Patescibacteria group bacterium]
MHKIFKFVISGGSATIANLSILYMLTRFAHIWYISSSIIAFLSAFMISFVLQKFWTFEDRSRDTIHKQAFMFFLTVLIGLCVNTALLYILVEYAGVHYIFAQIVSGIIVAVMNYFAYQKFIFHKI